MLTDKELSRTYVVSLLPGIWKFSVVTVGICLNLLQLLGRTNLSFQDQVSISLLCLFLIMDLIPAGKRGG